MYSKNKLKTLETRPSFVDNTEYVETNEKLEKKKQIALELEVNVIGTSTVKNFQSFF